MNNGQSTTDDWLDDFATVHARVVQAYADPGKGTGYDWSGKRETGPHSLSWLLICSWAQHVFVIVCGLGSLKSHQCQHWLSLDTKASIKGLYFILPAPEVQFPLTCTIAHQCGPFNMGQGMTDLSLALSSDLSTAKLHWVLTILT